MHANDVDGQWTLPLIVKYLAWWHDWNGNLWDSQLFNHFKISVIFAENNERYWESRTIETSSYQKSYTDMRVWDTKVLLSGGTRKDTNEYFSRNP